jgi:DNA-binding response OmpR family regulator
MIITDMRMESDAAGAEVIAAARSASYHPAIALLTAYPLADEDWQTLGADKMLVKPMHTQVLLQQIEKLLSSHEAKLRLTPVPAPTAKPSSKLTKPVALRTSRPSVKKTVSKRSPARTVALKSQSKKATKKSVAKAVVKSAKP